ncbi:MAG TPA: dihydrodipicolinate synthase family protein [Isosphaeraceae bacterium]|nr:dihydrodipicolinate synthase family protein [Isosphaeraceae bacterium]
MPGVLTGLIPACHTPFDRDGGLNLAAVQAQASLFRATGLRGVFIAGTTGEFSSLTVDERKALCDRWVDVAGDTLRVAVHVGSNCRADAIELAVHARQAGVAAIAVAPPSFFKPATVNDLVDFCAPIAAEVDPLPFYYYHIPSMTGVRLPMSEFLYDARFRIPNLRGLKFSHDDLVDLQGCVALEKGAYDILFGFDEALLAGLCLGVRGAVGCTYNFAGRHYLRLFRAFEAGDITAARAAQFEATQMVKTLASFGFLAASKAVMSLIGVDCGPVRAPLRNLTPAQLDELVGKLAAFDVFERPMKLSS